MFIVENLEKVDQKEIKLQILLIRVLNNHYNLKKKEF